MSLGFCSLSSLRIATKTIVSLSCILIMSPPWENSLAVAEVTFIVSVLSPQGPGIVMLFRLCAHRFSSPEAPFRFSLCRLPSVLLIVTTTNRN